MINQLLKACILLSTILLAKDSLAQKDSAYLKIYRDIPYKKVGNWTGLYDFYQQKSSTKVPLVIYIHGGGWTQGNKDREYDKIKIFIENGYAVANIGYRLAGTAEAPAAIEDLYEAIQQILKQSRKYNVDKENVFLMGGSAGAHLALVLAFQSHQPLYTGTLKSKPFTVRGVINKYGPTDLFTWRNVLSPSATGSHTWIASHAKDTNFIKSVSPYFLFTNQNIPTLFVHGRLDPSVSIEQAIKLYDKMYKAGVPVDTFYINNGKHGNFDSIANSAMNVKMISFIKQHEKRKR